jgi:LacI family transcriptional regulator
VVAVALLLTSAREFERGLRRGIMEYARSKGRWTVYGCVSGLTPCEQLDHLRGWHAQAAIIAQDHLAEVAPLGIPVVVVPGTNQCGTDVCQLLRDDEGIGHLAADTLLRLGLRHFGYFGVADDEFSKTREFAFAEALGNAGHSSSCYRSAPLTGGQSRAEERVHLEAWLRSLPKPAGVLAYNDDRAAMLAETCNSIGIPVPKDVAILGVDNDTHVCQSATPPLSSVALAAERGGYDAAAVLDVLMRRGTPASRTVVVHPTHVVPRKSTDTLAIDDPVVARALRFIRENANRDIRVADLPAASGVSRRTLQDRFRQCLSRTPMEEIHRCRVERLARLLVETDLSVREIAAASGFELDAHVARFFSRQTGFSPLEFRRRVRPL